MAKALFKRARKRKTERRDKRKLKRVTRREKRATKKGRGARAEKFRAQRETLEAGGTKKEARVAGRVAKAEAKGKTGRAKKIAKRAKRRGKVKEFLLGKDDKGVDKDVSELSEKGKEAVAGLEEKAKGFGADAERAAQQQLEMAAGLGAEEAEALDATEGAISEANALRVQQLGAAKLQEQRAGGEGTLISDVEQNIALQQQANQAATQALGGGPLGRALAANAASQGGQAALGAASKRSQEVADSEASLLGSLGSISDQDLAGQRIAQGIQVANLQNAVMAQQDLTTGTARLQLGAEENLFKIRNAQLQAADALRAAEFNRPKKKGLFGGILGAAGAVVGGIFGGGQGAAAGAAAGTSLGGAVTEQVNR